MKYNRAPVLWDVTCESTEACVYCVKGDQWIKKSDNVIGCTWLGGRGQLFSEASAHIMLYILYMDYKHTRSLFCTNGVKRVCRCL